MSAAKIPFRILDLPKELRLMIYEFVPICTRHKKVRVITEVSTTDLIVVAKSVPLALLATCKFVHHEAYTTLQAKVELIKHSTPRMILDSLNTSTLSNYNSILEATATEIGRMHQAIEYGTHWCPALNGYHLRRRLIDKGFMWAQRLDTSGLETLAMFIYHAGFYIQSRSIITPVEVALRPERCHTRKEVLNFKLALQHLYQHLSTIRLKHQVFIRLRLVKPNSLALGGFLYERLVDAFNEASAMNVNLGSVVREYEPEVALIDAVQQREWMEHDSFCF